MVHYTRIPELLAFIIDHLEDNPDRIAYHFLPDAESMQSKSCKEILSSAATVANRLANQDTKRALLIFNPGFDFISTLLGCFMSNTSAIPVTIPKPKTRDLFHHFLQHAQPCYILTTSNLKGRLTDLMPGEETDSPEIIEVDKLVSSQEPFQIPEITNEAAIIQYTSGSTSKPKGVTVSFDNLHHNLRAIKDHFGLDENSVSFSWLPHYHDMGLVDGLLTPIFNRCTGIFCSPLTIVPKPLNWLKFITQYKVTHTGGPNFIFDLCVDKIPKSEVPSIDLRGLSHFYVSAEPVRKITLERFASHFKDAGFQSSQFTPGYGLAEATLMVTCKERNKALTFHSISDQSYTKDYVGLGKTIPGITLKVIDPETLIEKGECEPGEIVLQGPTITKGYYNDSAHTLKAIVQLPGHTEVYLRTGDIGLLKNNELFVTGRLKDTIIIRGVQFQAEDLEYVAETCDPQLLPSGTAAFSIDQESGEKLILVQEIKKERWENCDKETVAVKIKEAIFNAFGLSIHDLLLVPQGIIPKTTSGKIRRRECKVYYEQQQF